jgi:hypothetical protein
MVDLGDMGLCCVHFRLHAATADMVEAYTMVGSMHNGPPTCFTVYAGSDKGIHYFLHDIHAAGHLVRVAEGVDVKAFKV